MFEITTTHLPHGALSSAERKTTIRSIGCDEPHAAQMKIKPFARPATTAIGALLFNVGACLFIAQSFAAAWKPPFIAGCATWLVGCLPYLLLGLHAAKVEKDCYRCLATIMQICGMLSFITGCVLGLGDVDSNLLWINHCFAIGSGLLLMDSLATLRVLWPSPDKASAVEVPANLLFCLAAGLGGYATALDAVRFGMCCWLAGALLYWVRPVQELRAAAKQVRSERTGATKGAAVCASGVSLTLERGTAADVHVARDECECTS